MADRFHTASARFRHRRDPDPATLGSQEDVAETLDSLTKHYGLRGYLLINVPSETSTDFSSNVLLTSWPDEMLKTYDHAGLIFGSPVIERLRQSTNPFTYDADRTNRRRADGKAAIAASLFERHGLSRGAYFPAHNSVGLRGALAFGGTRDVLNPREMAELNAVANLIFTEVVELRAGRRQNVSLSRREIECLSWASAGKTSVEMSEILGLSEYTVNHYLNRATRKLDAVNRVQAVAKAIRAGLLN
ncbi:MULTISPECIES: LuxR family transcriptional regulator [unclassified Shinella]|uniref:helix-turn-helix transcriptional regulator n=1 Tax=unclassified Shinella TaxID=2643062 RepID=UPI00225CA2CC|nr:MULTISPECIES: LuxR family transcriptional regulator [unclassified Shinella]MCO5136622.1 LuxR family transcriptional regulator [Shinella sp.]MDC7253701.1 LuxR family transcriptional regulator [Shinella sp. YE25]CAI0336343.1 DNA-binding CsgD family transcriptional regulator [Rhizobiaceae bacterium]CAK7254882.1 LuxR family transcriptional regulator, quorum-sensing system regulator BjaR1 [Shinella sp. WSC3-e]